MKQDINSQSFKHERNNVLAALSGLLSCSNYAKQAFLCCGFFGDIVKELFSVLDVISIVNGQVSF